MTSKAHCAQICCRGKSKLFRYLTDDLRLFFTYERSVRNAIALQIYFRKINQDISPDIYEVFFQKDTEYRRLAWCRLIQNLQKDTIENNQKLWFEQQRKIEIARDE